MIIEPRKFQSKNVPFNKSSYEFLAWLSYEPAHEGERVNQIRRKIMLYTDEEDRKFMVQRDYDAKYAMLIERYINRETSPEEDMEVNAYLGSHDVLDVIMRKLTPDEQAKARASKDEILSNYSCDEIREFLSENDVKTDSYKSMSMVDKYVYYLVSRGYWFGILLEESYTRGLQVGEAVDRKKAKIYSHPDLNQPFK